MRRSAIRAASAAAIFMVPAAVGAASGVEALQPPASSKPPAAATPGERLRYQVPMEVYITEGQMAIEAASIRILENFIEQALLFPDEPIELNGHTDNRNNPAEELAESKAWADAVGHYLVSKGIKAERISTGGLGATQPRVVVAPGTRERLNRRVNMTLGEKTRGW
jgi:outer membrane protein OmpA-like peptidoglycan-associated protein